MNNQSNLAHNVLPLRNPLQTYREVSEQIKALEKLKEEAKREIFNLMDIRQSDSVALGGLRAERQLIVQERIDTDKVRIALGDSLQEVITETAIIRLKVV